MKKVMLWSALLCILFTTGCFRMQIKKESKSVSSNANIVKSMEEIIHDTIIEYAENQDKIDNRALVYVEEHKTLRINEKEGKIIAYLQVVCEAYQQDLTIYSGYQAPVRLTFAQKKGKLVLEEFWFPKDGSLYEPSIREAFPEDLVKEAMELETYNEKVAQQRKDQAKTLFEKE